MDDGSWIVASEKQDGVVLVGPVDRLAESVENVRSF